MDEHRIGLQPIMRPVWAPTGQPVTRPVQPRYEWLYLYAFICPETGASQFWLLPEVNKCAYQLVVAAFARGVGAGPEHHVLLVEDGAGFHGPPQEGHPPGIEIVTMPAYSPELQPVERIWELTDAPLANRCFESLDELQTVLGQQVAWLETQPDRITQQTLFHWWPLCTN